MRVARKPSWVRTGQRALGGLLTSSAAEKEVGCPYGSPSRPLALVARGELGANRKLALLLLRSVRPKGGIPDQARRLALARLANAYSVTSCRLACAFPPVAGQRLGPTARLQRKSAVCGLNGFLPRLCLGSLHLNPSTPERFRGLLPFRLFSRRGKRETRASVLERKIALLGLIFPPKRNPKESWREGEDQGEHGRIPFVRDDGRLIKKQH